ncbi:MAG: hypothetical protein JW982_08930 [Spirochaetes bacterium]|nr:hypothetical protein [Spirochaetota bacterium]
MKKLSIILFILLILTNGFWLYNAVDMGVTQSYHDQVTYEFANRIVSLSSLANHYIHGISKESALGIIEDISDEDSVFIKDNAINSYWISISLDENENVKEVEITDIVRNWAEQYGDINK